MPDQFSADERSEIMRKVKSNRNKSTELKLIEIFRKHQVKGWRRNYPLLGKPDFVFPKKRTVLFADGCFWHGHDCRNTIPKNNEDYWQKKRSRNIQRDTEVTAALIQKGWNVIRIWECEIKKGEVSEKLKPLLSGTI